MPLVVRARTGGHVLCSLMSLLPVKTYSTTGNLEFVLTMTATYFLKIPFATLHSPLSDGSVSHYSFFLNIRTV